MSFEDAGKTVAHFLARLANDDGAGDIGGAVFVLGAGVDQEELVLRDGPVGGAGHAIMDNRAVGTCAGDGREGDILERAGLAAEAFERRHRVDFGELARRCLLVEPGEKSHHRRPVAFVGGPAADDLGVVLGGLHERNRVGAALRLGSWFGQQAHERLGRACLIQAHGLARKLAEIADQVIR